MKKIEIISYEIGDILDITKVSRKIHPESKAAGQAVVIRATYTPSTKYIVLSRLGNRLTLTEADVKECDFVRHSDEMERFFLAVEKGENNGNTPE